VLVAEIKRDPQKHVKGYYVDPNAMACAHVRLLCCMYVRVRVYMCVCLCVHRYTYYHLLRVYVYNEYTCTLCVRQCGKKDEVKRCSKCKRVCYCSRECQTAAWTKHKSSCKYIANTPPHVRKKLRCVCACECVSVYGCICAYECLCTHASV
jgi:hypothetical protein